MSLSTTTLNLLKQISSENQINGFDSNEDLCDRLFKILLGHDRSLVSISSLNETLVKAVWCCAVESVKLGLEPEQLDSLLKNFNHSIIPSIVSSYRKYGKAIRDAMKTAGWTYPKMIDIDWRISGLMETNNQEKIKEPLVELTFKSLSADATSSDAFSFSCTKNQLLELRWKVKEAQNMLQKLSNS